MPLRFSDDIPERFAGYVRQCRNTPGLACELAAKAAALFPSFDAPDLLEQFVTTRLPPGRVLIAGAGPTALRLVTAIEHRCPGLEIAALVDRRAGELREAQGYQVLTAREAALRPYDYAIVCNPVYEQSMVADLREAGVPQERIRAVLSSPDYRAFTEAFLANDLEARLLAKIGRSMARVENVILAPSRDIWSVVDEAALAAVLPPESTIRLYFGPGALLEPSPFYPTYDMGGSLPLMLRILGRLQPRCVYVRGSAHFRAQHVGVAVRRQLPDCFLAFEVYDYMSMFDDEILDGWGFDRGEVRDNRLAEALLGLEADFLFDKTPGPGWRKVAEANIRAPRRAFNPRLQGWTPPAPAEARPDGPFRLLCAGTVPAFWRYRPGHGFLDSAFQDIIRPIELLAGSGDCVVDIFNGGHLPGYPGCERDYGGYRTVFPPQRVSYHPALPFGELLATMGQYDFGMFLFAPTDVVIDYPLQESLPNRFMGYVSGNLPIIINKEIRYSASLVERFQAGITIGAEELEDLPRRIRQADLAAMRRGVADLRRFLLDQNQEAIEAFQGALAARALPRSMR